MADMTIEEREALRTMIGNAVIETQNRVQDGHTPLEVMPEIVSALLSLACFVGKTCGGMSDDQMKMAFDIANQEPSRHPTLEEWPGI